MKKLILTIRHAATQLDKVLEVSALLPSEELVTLIKILFDCPSTTIDGQPLQYWLSTTDGKPIRIHSTLDQADIENNMTLLLHAGTQLPAEVAEETANAPREAKQDKASPTPVPEAQKKKEAKSVPASWKKVSG